MGAHAPVPDGLAQADSPMSFEVVLVDDASSDETPVEAPTIEGLRYVRRDENGGFISACNDGAASARGEFLVFLNNDTVPQPGWLEALLGTFETLDGIGLVGSQLLASDGRLQEAGGLVFSDGSAGNYGRLSSRRSAVRLRPRRRLLLRRCHRRPPFPVR